MKKFHSIHEAANRELLFSIAKSSGLRRLINARRENTDCEHKAIPHFKGSYFPVFYAFHKIYPLSDAILKRLADGRVSAFSGRKE
ncbi:MAG: hypothetical protein WC091_16135 [Sulfuricellaceae bacterium]